MKTLIKKIILALNELSDETVNKNETVVNEQFLQARHNHNEQIQQVKESLKQIQNEFKNIEQ